MDLPKLLSADEVASYLEVSVSTLDRWRTDLIGPNFVKVGGGIRYLESDVLEYLQSQRQLPTESQRMAAVVRAGAKEVSRALQQRNAELAAADREDQETSGVTPLVLGTVGHTPGEQIVRVNNVPAQTTFSPPPPHILKDR